MESLGSAIGVAIPYTRKPILTSSRPVDIKLVFRDKASSFSCLSPFRKEVFCESCVASRMVLQKEGKKNRVLQCKNSSQETQMFVGNDDDASNLIQRKKLAVFVSGGGSNFRAIHEATMAGLINADVTVFVTDKPGCGGANYAKDNQIPILLFPNTKYSPNGLSPIDLVANLRKHEVDFVLLAGYLKLIPVELVRAYPKSILNIHPSLLPAFGGKGFYGLKVHQAVIASGARYSGPTIHFVDEHYDTGRILAQRVVPVLANDTPEQLAARVLQQEHQLYVEVVSALCENRITWRGDGVPLICCKEDPNKLY